MHQRKINRVLHLYNLAATWTAQQRTGAHDTQQRRTSTCSGAARYHSKHSVHIPTGAAQRRSDAKQVKDTHCTHADEIILIHTHLLEPNWGYGAPEWHEVVLGCPWWILWPCQVMLRIQQKIRQELAHTKRFEGGLGGWKHVLVLTPQKHRAMHVLNMLKWQESPSVADLRPTSRFTCLKTESSEQFGARGGFSICPAFAFRSVALHSWAWRLA